MNGVPWCVIFLCWCFDEAGLSSLFFGGARTASCGTLLGWYKSNGTAKEKGWKRGDVVFFRFSDNKTRNPEHVGIVTSVSSDGRTVYTIEGNTGSGNDANGGQVQRRTRSVSDIVGGFSPDYESMDPKLDNTPDKYAAEAVAWALERGIMQGDTNGDLKLHDPCTRQQMIVFLHRALK